MTDIDYEALAKAIYLTRYTQYVGPDVGTAVWNWNQDFNEGNRENSAEQARAVVAAYDQQLRDQGMVVVRAADIDPLMLYVDDCDANDRLTAELARTFERLEAALVAASDSAEEDFGEDA